MWYGLYGTDCSSSCRISVLRRLISWLGFRFRAFNGLSSSKSSSNSCVASKFAFFDYKIVTWRCQTDFRWKFKSSIAIVLTSGTKGGSKSLSSRVSQSIDLNHGCFLVSSNPAPLGLHPNRRVGSRSNSWIAPYYQCQRLGIHKKRTY